MRLVTLLLTFLVLAVGGYCGGFSLYHRDWTDAYSITLTALGGGATLSTFFLGQIFGRLDKLMEFPLDPLQQAAFRRTLRKRRFRLVIKYWLGAAAGIAAIAFANALRVAKFPVFAGLATGSAVIGLVCLVLLVIEFVALSGLGDRLREESERQNRKREFLSGSAA